MALRIEEILAPEVYVTLLVARMDGRGIDFNVDLRLRDVRIVQRQITPTVRNSPRTLEIIMWRTLK
jgi:hypothetical protein